MAATVFIIDDDAMVLQTLCSFVETAGFHTVAFSSAEAFLDAEPMSAPSPRCLLLDLRLPGLSGLGLLEQMPRLGMRIPTIIVTGAGSLSMAVQAMKLGAMDLIEKPAHRQLVLERVQYALDLDASFQREMQQRGSVHARMLELSPREREIMQMCIDGMPPKAISLRLNISMKTVSKHRTQIFRKMQVDSVVDLVRMLGGNNLSGGLG